MRHLIILLLFSIAFCNAYSQDIEYVNKDTIIPNGHNIFYYEDSANVKGKKSSEGLMKNGKPEGIWKSYYENGKIKSIGKRNNHLLDSTWKFYNEKGFITGELYYKNGLKDSIHKTYYDSSVIRSVELYKADKRHGTSIYYNKKGVLLREIPFMDGVEEGIAKEYDEDEDVVVLISIYKNGFLVKEQEINRKDIRGLRQGIWKYFYPGKQQVKWEGIFKNNLKHGTFREYDIDGKLIKTEDYLNGELVDFIAIEKSGKKVKMEIRREYHPNAQDKIVGAYKNGVPEGVFREYSIDGQVIDSKIYQNGKVMKQGIMDDSGLEQGPWKFFYDSGNIRAEGQYKDGKQTGPWKYYHENGALMQEGSYVVGKAEGIWKWYYENGKLLREENYKKGTEIGDAREYIDSVPKIITMGTYEDGKKEGFWVYEIGDVKASGKYTEGREDGLWKEVYKNGAISFEGNYMRGLEHGIHRYFYDNGQLKEERNYRQGMKNGNWKVYDRDGSLVLTIQYRDDKEMKIDGMKLVAEKIKRGRIMKK